MLNDRPDYGDAFARGADWVRPRSKEETEDAALSASAQQPLIARLMEDAPAAAAPVSSAERQRSEESEYEYEYYDAPVQSPPNGANLSAPAEQEAKLVTQEDATEEVYDYYEDPPAHALPELRA